MAEINERQDIQVNMNWSEFVLIEEHLIPQSAQCEIRISNDEEIAVFVFDDGVVKRVVNADLYLDMLKKLRDDPQKSSYGE